jgi:Zn-dependent M28 family amino/carboxypeptidase
MKRYLVLLAVLALAACNQPKGPVGADTITGAEIAGHIKVLAADDFGGREPSTPGEEKTLAYVKGQFESYGLQPGNHGSWFQDVPLVKLTAGPVSDLVVTGKGQTSAFKVMDDMMALTRRVTDHIDVKDSEMVFVGYGIVAPEYGWNDYAGLDMKGKTAVILVNDPGYATKDPQLFNGYAMTYYGRWTYKYEEAARQGAVAAIIIHETGAAAYPWAVVQAGWSGPKFYALADDNNMSRAEVEGWVTTDAAKRIFQQAGFDYDAALEAAKTPGFKPVPLGLKASVWFPNAIDHSTSKNVVALLPGSEHPDEYFIYMGHWDHLGTDPTLEGDQIYNGALDNASGTAALLEIAQAFASLPKAPKRSIIFLSLTAEEQGLLGSEHYADDPIYPLDHTVAGINMDGINLIGRTHDIQVVGYGMSELDGYLERAAAKQGRVIAPDSEVEKGYYFRSDHFNLAKKGVPMLDPGSGIDSVEHGAEWGQAQADDYTANRYHKPADEYDPTWDMSGAEEDVRLFFDFGETIADSDAWPNWKEGTEFRAIRDEEMAGKK